MKKSVLLIDDDPDELVFFREAVADISLDYECLTSTDGEETLQQLIQEEIKPNFIFLDLIMPRMNGIDLLRQIKKIPHLSQIPVIIYTSSQYVNYLAQCLESGAFSVAHKVYG